MFVYNTENRCHLRRDEECAFWGEEWENYIGEKELELGTYVRHRHAETAAAPADRSVFTGGSERCVDEPDRT